MQSLTMPSISYVSPSKRTSFDSRCFRDASMSTTPKVGSCFRLHFFGLAEPIVTCFVAVDISHQPCCSSL
jgi:hypothetical protein